MKAVNLDSIKSNSMFKKVQIFLIAVMAIGNVDAQKIKLRSETQETPKTKLNDEKNQ